MSTDFDAQLRARIKEIDREITKEVLWTLFWIMCLVAFAGGLIFLAWKAGAFEPPKATATVVVTVAPEVAR